MKVLLDECIDPKAARFFPREFEVMHLKDTGWLGVKNGQLDQWADRRFDVLLTIDSNMRHQTSLANLELAVVVLEGHFRAVTDYAEPVEKFASIAKTIRQGAFTVIQRARES